MPKHLAILSRSAIRSVISGQKSTEIRFSEKKIAPFGQVHIGDIVYMKPPGEEIIGQFEVQQVISFEGLNKDDWDLIERHFKSGIGLDQMTESDFFKKHKNAVYATVIKIGTVEQFITSPVKIVKKDLRGWLVIDD